MGVALLSLSDAPTKFFLVFMALTGLHLYRQHQPEQVRNVLHHRGTKPTHI
jgi:Ni,Fe-hydrogenase I cytochrome b subunit